MSSVSSMAEERPYVAMRGIVLIKTESYSFPPPMDKDLFEYMESVGHMFGLPRDFCAEDVITGDYRYFECLICDSTMDSVHTLRSHVFGKKHSARVLEHMRKLHGAPNRVVTAATIKDSKRDMTPADITETLAKRLDKEPKPAIGLEYVTEFAHSRNQVRYYTCSLDGCSSAWGNSDDMARHVTNTKHHKNYLKTQFPGDPRITSMNKADVLTKATDIWLQSGRTETDKIKVVYDDCKHREIATRPPSWSAKKNGDGKIGNGDFSANANMMPLGQRRAVKREASPNDRSALYAYHANGSKKISFDFIMVQTPLTNHTVPENWERKKLALARSLRGRY